MRVNSGSKGTSGWTRISFSVKSGHIGCLLNALAKSCSRVKFMPVMRHDPTTARIVVRLGEPDPKLRRTILVDRQTGLPMYEIFAGATQLDSPIWKIQYTYPRDITIEPPVR